VASFSISASKLRRHGREPYPLLTRVSARSRPLACPRRGKRQPRPRVSLSVNTRMPATTEQPRLTGVARVPMRPDVSPSKSWRASDPPAVHHRPPAPPSPSSTVPIRASLNERGEQTGDPVRKLAAVGPSFQRCAEPQTVAKVEHDRPARIGGHELIDDRVEAGNDLELSDQPISLVTTDLDDVRRNPDPNRIGPTRFHPPTA
jgi:hypothetical protein